MIALSPCTVSLPFSLPERWIRPAKRRRHLFGGETQGLAAFVYHFAHFADAARAAHLGVAGLEDLRRSRRAGRDRRAHLTFPDAVAVADVHGRSLSTHM